MFPSLTSVTVFYISGVSYIKIQYQNLRDYLVLNTHD